MEYETRIIQIAVLPKGEAIFCERATLIEIEDEAGGEFVRVSQHGIKTVNAEISIEPSEWLMLSAGITDMIARCR